MNKKAIGPYGFMNNVLGKGKSSRNAPPSGNAGGGSSGINKGSMTSNIVIAAIWLVLGFLINPIVGIIFFILIIGIGVIIDYSKSDKARTIKKQLIPIGVFVLLGIYTGLWLVMGIAVFAAVLFSFKPILGIIGYIIAVFIAILPFFGLIQGFGTGFTLQALSGASQTQEAVQEQLAILQDPERQKAMILSPGGSYEYDPEEFSSIISANPTVLYTVSVTPLPPRGCMDEALEGGGYGGGQEFQLSLQVKNTGEQVMEGFFYSFNISKHNVGCFSYSASNPETEGSWRLNPDCSGKIERLEPGLIETRVCSGIRAREEAAYAGAFEVPCSFEGYVDSGFHSRTRYEMTFVHDEYASLLQRLDRFSQSQTGGTISKGAARLDVGGVYQPILDNLDSVTVQVVVSNANPSGDFVDIAYNSALWLYIPREITTTGCKGGNWQCYAKDVDELTDVTEINECGNLGSSEYADYQNPDCTELCSNQYETPSSINSIFGMAVGLLTNMKACEACYDGTIDLFKLLPSNNRAHINLYNHMNHNSINALYTTPSDVQNCNELLDQGYLICVYTGAVPETLFTACTMDLRDATPNNEEYEGPLEVGEDLNSYIMVANLIYYYRAKGTAQLSVYECG